ncbi:hypothetical protein LTR62_007491 [Meristemomyces frigidus]|uniref:Arylamine N-acetyltransferase n=1 Tax=Meristemomyces frigidus TaxID=1508187 RepID=A0AAN7TIY0_9PEZI|nr:hypothetical protein LTR62_007491 [Meristemomyces frigidus]
MADRARYDRTQLEKCFDRICLPKTKRMYDVSVLSDDEKLAYLSLLHKHELVKIPWENLTQHYSWHRVVNVEPQHLFNKIISNPGRGGYCMEANSFFGTVLLSLGFHTYMAGARICKSKGVFGGWTHVVNLVKIGGTKYVLDGGFGPQESPKPLALQAGVVETHIAPSQMRVVYQPIPQFVDQSQRIWIYQHRRNETAEWADMYCFTDMEFTTNDITSMNFSPWINPQSFFTHKVVAVRFTTDRSSADEPGADGEAELEGEVDGSLVLNQDVLKWRRKGEKVLEWTFKDDGERVEALRKYFGIVLVREDLDAIKGTAAEVAAKGMDHD